MQDFAELSERIYNERLAIGVGLSILFWSIWVLFTQWRVLWLTRELERLRRELSTYAFTRDEARNICREMFQVLLAEYKQEFNLYCKESTEIAISEELGRVNQATLTKHVVSSAWMDLYAKFQGELQRLADLPHLTPRERTLRYLADAGWEGTDDIVALIDATVPEQEASHSS